MSDTSRSDDARWIWSSGDRAFLWWDGNDFTDSHAFWSGNAWVCSDARHEAPMAGPPPALPGWYDAPDESGARQYWDGTTWTTNFRRHAPRRAMTLMASLSLTGIGLLVWGGAIATRSPLWAGPIDCEAQHLPTPPGSLWIIWFALAAVAISAGRTFAKWGRGDGRMAWLAVLGMLSTMITFPLWLVIGAGMDCGL